MLSVQTQLRLARFIKAIADHETSIEITRQSLAKDEGFEPQLAFKRLDASNQNFLSEKDFIRFLAELNISYSSEDVKSIIKQFSSHENSRLTYSDFENATLPATRLDLRQEAISRKRFKTGKLSYTAALVLGRLLQKVIEGTKKLETLQNELTSARDWNLTEAFMAIDYRRESFLTQSSVLDFLKDRQVRATFEDTTSFMRRADQDGDGKVNYREFSAIIGPVLRLDMPTGSPERQRRSYDTYAQSSSSKESILRSPGYQDSYLTGKTFLKYQVYTPERRQIDKDLETYLYPISEKDLSRVLGSINDDIRNISSSKHKRVHLLPQENNEPLKKSITPPRAFLSEVAFLRSVAPDKLVPGLKPKSPSSTVKSESSSSGIKSESSSYAIKSETPSYAVKSGSSASAIKSEASRMYSPPTSSVRFTPHQQNLSAGYASSSYAIKSENSRMYSPPTSSVRFTPHQQNISAGYAGSSPKYSSGIKVTNPYPATRNSERLPRRILLEEELPLSPKVKPFSPTSHRDEEFNISGYRRTSGRNHQVSFDRETMTSSKNYRSEQAFTDTKDREYSEYIFTSQKRPPIDYASSPRTQSSPDRYSKTNTRSQKSPLKGYEEEYLTNSIKEIIQLERELERRKGDLILKKDFNIASCYRKVISQNQEEGANQEQFEDNMRNFGVFFTQTEVSAVFERFDHDGDGVISFKDFEHLVTPSSKHLAGNLTDKDSTQELEDRTLKLFISLIKKLAEAEVQIADIRVHLSKRFTLEDAFKAIDIKDCGYIEADELRSILTYHGVFPSTADLDSLVYRIDHDDDGKLSAKEFTKGFSPLKAVKEEEHEDTREDRNADTKEVDKEETKEEIKEVPGEEEEGKEETQENAEEGLKEDDHTNEIEISESKDIAPENESQEQPVTQELVEEDSKSETENQKISQPNEIPIDERQEQEEVPQKHAEVENAEDNEDVLEQEVEIEEHDV